MSDDTVESRPVDVAVLGLISHALRAPLLRQALHHARYRACPAPNAVWGRKARAMKIVFVCSNDAMRYALCDS